MHDYIGERLCIMLLTPTGIEPKKEALIDAQIRLSWFKSYEFKCWFFKGLLKREYRIPVRLQRLFESAKRQRQVSVADCIRTVRKQFKMMTASHSAYSIKYEVIIEFSFQKNVSSCDVLFLLILLTDHWYIFFVFVDVVRHLYCSTSRNTAPTPFSFLFFLFHTQTHSL